jgi:transcriptional regulator with XRE-family HTH domain
LKRSVYSDAYTSAMQSLKTARQRAGLSQAKVAKRLRRPQTYVSKYELGERRLDVVEFVAAAIAIGADPLPIIAGVIKQLRS